MIYCTGLWSDMAPTFVGPDGSWCGIGSRGAPDTIRLGIALYPALQDVWRSFTRLSRGRPHSAYGAPLPIPYADMVTELDRLKWPDPDQAERFLDALDDKFLALASEASKSS